MTSSTSSSHASSVNADMFASGRYSDLTIICQGERFKVHRAVVCLQSKPLAAAVDGKFKEAVTGEIDLDDCEPAIVKRFLEFLYLGDYSDNRSLDMQTASNECTAQDVEESPGYGGPKTAKLKNKKGKRTSEFVSKSSPPERIPTFQHVAPPGEDGPFLLNVKLYIMADRYDVQPLKSLAKKKYQDIIVNGWNDPSFAPSLKLLYDGTLESDRLMKDMAIETAGEHARVLVDRGEFATLLKSNGEIAFDILKASLNSTAIKACLECGQTTYVTRVRNQWNCGRCLYNFY